MMNRLVVLALTFSVGASAIGCGQHSIAPTTSPQGELSSSVSARNLVDVSALWATKPLPPCDDYLGTDLTVPPGLSVPDHDGVAKILAGVKSPGSIEWVKTKLGWLDKALSETRADMVSYNGTPGGDSQLQDFKNYVEHVKIELAQGQDIDSPLDLTYPEACQ